MVSISSLSDVLDAIHRARTITVVAYALWPGAMEHALLDAAHRNAHVVVRLEGQPYADPDGRLQAASAAAIDELAKAGADARFMHAAGSREPPLHAKAVIADEALFLDDRNWAAGGDTILRDGSARDRRIVFDALRGRENRATARFSMHKREALEAEAGILVRARSGDDVALASESFGAHNPVYRILDELARRGFAPRLLVNVRDLHANVAEQRALARLSDDGVRVRVGDADEKFAVAGTRGWTGSANATADFDAPDQIDWGMIVDGDAVVRTLRERFESRWSAAAPLQTKE